MRDERERARARERERERKTKVRARIKRVCVRYILTENESELN